MKVHVVEDDADLQRAAKFFLEKNNITVSQTTDGNKATADVLANQPDAVLLDIMLPGMSGYDVLDELRQAEFDKPVIIMSNLEVNDVDKKRLEEHGVTSIYLKVTTDFDDIVAELLDIGAKQSQQE